MAAAASSRERLGASALTDDLQILTRYGQAAEPDDLFSAALALAALEAPGRDPAPYQSFLRGLLADLRPLAGAAVTAADRATLLADCLHARHGFSGDRETYDDLANADLMAVIDRRKGLPVTLGILYIHLARALGWSACGLNFPAHFLVRIDCGPDRVILDPFHDGAILTAAGMRQLLKSMTGETAELKPAHYAPVSDRDLLLRLLTNIKVRRLSAGDFAGAIAALRRMLLIAPHRAETWYDVATLELHRGDRAAGRDALEKCLAALDMESDSTKRHSELRQRVLKSLRELPPLME